MKAPNGISSEQGSSNVQIVGARPHHFAAIATLHRIALPHGFLSRLGDGVLEHLYGGISSHPDSTVLVAIDSDDTVLGYVSGTSDVRGCYRHVLTSRAVSIGWAALPSLVRPSTLLRVFETLTYPFRFRGRARRPNEPNPDCSAELLSIAVDRRSRGHRVGQRLVNGLEDFLASRSGAVRYRVVTDATDPHSNAFYERCGFRRLGAFTNHGHPMTMYVKEIGEDTETTS